jgi:hypothetical protein
VILSGLSPGCHDLHGRLPPFEFQAKFEGLLLCDKLTKTDVDC